MVSRRETWPSLTNWEVLSRKRLEVEALEMDGNIQSLRWSPWPPASRIVGWRTGTLLVVKGLTQGFSRPRLLLGLVSRRYVNGHEHVKMAYPAGPKWFCLVTESFCLLTVLGALQPTREKSVLYMGVCVGGVSSLPPSLSRCLISKDFKRRETNRMLLLHSF